MNITLNLFYSWYFLFMGNFVPHRIKKLQIESYDQVRQTAIQDFSRTRLYKKDSAFLISVDDTLHRMTLNKIDVHHYEWVGGTIYPDIIDVSISAYQNKFFLDTTIDVSAQTKYIPSRCIELNGKLFFWYDKHYTLTNNAIKILGKYHLLRHGGPNDAEDFHSSIDDAAQAADYFFCRSNLHVYKRVITNKAIGYYDPPNVKCK
jgi:hypothetical protein